VEFDNRENFEAMREVIKVARNRVQCGEVAFCVRGFFYHGKRLQLINGKANQAPHVGIAKWAIREYRDKWCRETPLPPDTDDDDGDDDDDDNGIGSA